MYDKRIENITDFKKNSALYPDYFAIKWKNSQYFILPFQK